MCKTSCNSDTWNNIYRSLLGPTGRQLRLHWSPKININIYVPVFCVTLNADSVCLSVCLSVRPIFWYFISRLLEKDIDLICIQDTCTQVTEKIDLHRSKVKVTVTVHCFLKVQ